MQTLYNFGIQAYGLGIRIASLFSAKAQEFIGGRKDWRAQYLSIKKDPKAKIWLHAASLGEMEQGVPILKKLRKELPHHHIVISFFSPSGYLNFKQRDLAEHIIYLPLDSPRNAGDLIKIIKPELSIFIKYEIWINLFKALNKEKLPLILAPAVFRSNQIYFQPIAKNFFLPVLNSIDKIMVQNIASQNLLKAHNITKVEICGDSRFDQAIANTREEYVQEKVVSFLEDRFCLIFGSAWPPEEAFIQEILNSFPKIKIILAPHDVSEANIHRITKKFAGHGVNLFSDEKWNNDKPILIINNIGHLKKLYRYAQAAFIGGGYGTGLHSTVEAVAYKIPVFFGPKHHKFQEVSEFISGGFGFQIESETELLGILRKLQEQGYRKELRGKIEKYLPTKTGAADKICAVALKLLETP